MNKIFYLNLFFSYFLFLYLFFFTQLKDIYFLYFQFLFLYSFHPLNISFIFTFLYQLLSILYVKKERIREEITSFLFLFSTLYPVSLSLLSINNIEIFIEYLTYPILSISLSFPLIILLTYFKKEKGYWNPLKLVLYFISFYSMTIILLLSYNYQRVTKGEVIINKLGVSELELITLYVLAISNIVKQVPLPENYLQTMQSFYFQIPIELIILFIISSLIYSLFSIINNINHIENNFYYVKRNLIKINLSSIYKLKVLFFVLFIAVILLFLTFMSSLQLISFDFRFFLIILIIPYVLIFVLVFLTR